MKKKNDKKDNPDICIIDEESKETISDSGVYFKTKKETCRPQTASDVYSKAERKLDDSGVAVPTEDFVMESKEWVDDINRK